MKKLSFVLRDQITIMLISCIFDAQQRMEFVLSKTYSSTVCMYQKKNREFLSLDDIVCLPETKKNERKINNMLIYSSKKIAINNQLINIDMHGHPHF